MSRRTTEVGRPAAPGDPAYRAALERLYERRRFGLQPGLDVMRALLGALDHPEAKFPAIHVTGSKGKGSTAAIARAVLSAHGRRVGLYTSPHLVSYRERMRIDDRPISPGDVVAGLGRVEAAAEALEAEGAIDRAPTFFEVTTALAFDWFAARSVDAAVVEVGIGGRLDATNVLASRVGVITTIELEHTEILGATREAIAREKSGILHAGMTGVVGTLPEDARAVVDRVATTAGVSLWHLGEEFRILSRDLSPEGQTLAVSIGGERLTDLSLPLLGTFQAPNAAMAIAAVARFLAAEGRTLNPDAVRRGLTKVRWRGRLERIARRPELFYDVAHTPESARALAESLGEIAPLADPTDSAIVFGCLAGKDVGRILDALAPIARTLVVVPVRSARGMPTAEVRAAAIGRFPKVVVAPSGSAGVALARAATGAEGFTVVTGSDYLVGELLRDPASGDEPDLSDPGQGPPPERPAEVR